jgi:hypothetical protein
MSLIFSLFLPYFLSSNSRLITPGFFFFFLVPHRPFIFYFLFIFFPTFSFFFLVMSLDYDGTLSPIIEDLARSSIQAQRGLLLNSFPIFFFSKFMHFHVFPPHFLLCFFKPDQRSFKRCCKIFPHCH